MSAPTVVVQKRRSLTQFFLVIFAQSLALSVYFLTHLNRDNALPKMWIVATAVWFGIGLVTHLLVRVFTPYADPLILPIVLLLNGLGLAMIHRLDLDALQAKHQHNMTRQFYWTMAALLVFTVVMWLVKDLFWIQKYTYVAFLTGLVLLLLPMMPVIGKEINGSRIWVGYAGYSLQPGEFAKIVLTIAFASYLTEKRDALALAGKHFLGIDWPRPRDLGPILIMWVAAVLILVVEKDLGSSLLFFGLFVVMLYVATERPGWAILGFGMFFVAAIGGYTLFGHVRRRFSAWLDPFSDFDHNYQIIVGQFGIDHGGLVGQGWGQGMPNITPLAKSDMIVASLTEEGGIAIFMAIVVLYAFIVARGLRAALVSHDNFHKLLATGLSFTFALQVFTIIGGVTRALPLTGLTTPFMSQGGTSVMANYVVVALLLAVSHQARRPRETPASVYAPHVAMAGNTPATVAHATIPTTVATAATTGAFEPTEELR